LFVCFMQIPDGTPMFGEVL